MMKLTALWKWLMPNPATEALPVTPTDQVDIWLSRLAHVAPSDLNRYNLNKAMSVTIDVWHPNVEFLLNTIDVIRESVSEHRPLPEQYTTEVLYSTSLTIDDWFVSDDRYSVSIHLLLVETKKALKEFQEIRAELELASSAKRSYYMRATDKLIADLSTLVDLLTHDWR